ncbi:MAG: hypothetical protein GY906_10295 [bacterium]|nr:hypothetical protein [bacterium]
MEQQPSWYDNRTELIGFLRWYAEENAHLIGIECGVIDIVEKPWKWNDEYEAFKLATADPRWYQSTECPRCKHECPPQYPSLSRTDNETYICDDCGTNEAIENMTGPCTPQSDWPVSYGN